MNKIIQALIKLLIASVYFIYTLFCIPILLTILLIGFFMPLTISFKQGWNIKQKLIQFNGELKGLFRGG